MIRSVSLVALLLSSSNTLTHEVTPPPVFRFHLLGETYSLDPAMTSGSSGTYLFHNLMRGLYRYNEDRGLVHEGAKVCKWVHDKRLECELANTKWSNGELVRPQQYVASFRRVVNPVNKGAHFDLVKNLKNASAIFTGTMPVESLGISSIEHNGKDVVVFDFDRPDPEFEYKLALPQLAPIYSTQFPSRENATKLVSNGPYKIEQWSLGRSVRLTSNSQYGTHPISRPSVEILFIEDDETALRLYESGRLSFLRRLPSQHIDLFRSRSDFLQIPMARFDYLGFGPRLRSNKNLRMALAQSLNYAELQKILHARGRPGCPSLPARYFKTTHCLEFNKRSAVGFWKAAGPTSLPSISLKYSKMGGEDIKRQVEWYQHQWKQNLNLNVEVEGIEQGMLLKTLKFSPGDVFRKGQALERPTCLSALEMFLPDHPENYASINHPPLTKVIQKLSQTSLSQNQKKTLCSQALKIAVEEALIIPLGEIHFTMLVSPQWTGWSLNELNQLDLGSLGFSVSK
jgi:oligopeptide transport system substrate-binding protein